jgi:hypothetical protein
VVCQIEIGTYVVQGSTMLRRFNDLNGSVIAGADADIGRQGHLRQTHRTGVRVATWATDLERRDDRVAHIWRVLAEPKVDIDQGSVMTREPTRLEGKSTTVDGPFGSVGRSGHTAT